MGGPARMLGNQGYVDVNIFETLVSMKSGLWEGCGVHQTTRRPPAGHPYVEGCRARPVCGDSTPLLGAGHAYCDLRWQ
ncbi:hypothetical protein F751_3989 [Auxenochlorella protothecoides]|uniref:Uncharacterized protein n=1 Tax=Auxenochlorella protothecoides TaxID=3075 RepID=A0A087SHV5_AUXPR|nr:hypothetical protein F751_3989 [Auxenochlorella protothecoides]KFM25309.1 hypothetical protein F751_3989 [Auxenochlorella protothecoides]